MWVYGVRALAPQTTEGEAETAMRQHLPYESTTRVSAQPVELRTLEH